LDIDLEALRNVHIALNAASHPPSFSKIYLKKHLDGKNYFAVDNIQVITEGVLVNRFEIGTIRVLYNHHLFTKPGF